MQEYQSWDFVPNQWVKTIQNTAIPIGSFGIYGISSIAFLLGGYYGLFFLGPIFFAACGFFRLNAVTFLPLEILILVGFSLYTVINREKSELKLNNMHFNPKLILVEKIRS